MTASRDALAARPRRSASARRRKASNIGGPSGSPLWRWCRWAYGSSTAIIRLVGADLDDVRDWVGHPLPAILLVLLLIAIFYHAALGLQVVIEDYVHAELAKLGLFVVVRLACFAFAVAGIFAVVSMAVGTSS